MKISEFKEWAKGKGVINPLSEDEILHSFLEHTENGKTDRKIHTYVFPSGRVIKIYCDKEETIVEVKGEEDPLVI